MKKLLALFTLAAVVSFSGGCSLFQKAPEKPAEEIVKESVSNLFKVTSASYELSMDGTLVGAPGQAPANMKFDGKVSGVFDEKESKKPQFTMKAAGNLTVDKNDSQAVDVELRLNKTDLYVMLTKLPDLGDTLPKDVVAMFVGKWWRIAVPEGTFDQMGGLSLGGEDEASMTPEQKAAKELLDKTAFFKDLKFAENDTVDGVSCYRYSGALDKDSLKNFLVEAAKIQKSEVTEADLQNFDAFMKATTAPVDMWIDPAGMTLKKINAKLNVAPENAGSFVLNISFKVGDLNEEVVIDVPENATLFDPAAMFGGGL